MRISVSKIAMYSSLLLALSCEDNYTICDKPKQVNYKAGFYTKNGSLDVPTVPAALTLTFPGASTFIYNQQPGIPALFLALSPASASDSVKYFIKLGNTLPADTISLYYNNVNQNLGPECGDITVHLLSRAVTTTHTIDSVKIVAPLVDNVVKENFKIYY
jgi:hypothetical protein